MKFQSPHTKISEEFEHLFSLGYLTGLNVVCDDLENIFGIHCITVAIQHI